jgi:Gpi18-like mannosyltransferase
MKDAIKAAAAPIGMYLMLILLTHQEGHAGDLASWNSTIIETHQFGIGNIYTVSETEYPPVFLEILWLLGYLIPLDKVASYNWVIKTVPLLAEIGIVILLSKKLLEKQQPTNRIWFYCLNAAIVYNSFIWGQVDALLTAGIIYVIYLISVNQSVTAAGIFWLTLNCKFQAIIYLPYIGFVLLVQLNTNRKKWLQIIINIALISLIIWMPFILSGNLLEMFLSVATSVDLYPKLSMNACNIWYFVEKDALNAGDQAIRMGLSYKSWGLMFFIFNAALIALPHCILQLRKNSTALSMENLARVLALINLAFFLFPTQMHERYVHPAISLLAIPPVLNKNTFIWPYIVASIAYYLNLDRVIKFHPIASYHTLIYDPRFLAVLFLLVYCWELYRYYKDTLLPEKAN